MKKLLILLLSCLAPIAMAQTTEFAVTEDQDAADLAYGVVKLSRWDLSEHLWIQTGLMFTAGSTSYSSGRITLSGELADMTLLGGTFDAGEIRVRYR